MRDGVLLAATVVGALGCGIVGGIFFAFSAFVMRALARSPARQGPAAMQAIDVAVLNPWFLSVFAGTAVVSLGLMIAAILVGQAAGGWLRLAGGGLYLAGCFLVTGVYHVPRNEALAARDPDGAGNPARWTRYVRGWTAWNTVRTVSSLAAGAAFMLALIAR